jgi:hypothetical protein
MIDAVRSSNAGRMPLQLLRAAAFGSAWDRGPYDVALSNIDIGSGESIGHRVDPGPGGDVSCDWTYVRNFVFRHQSATGAKQPRDLVFAENFH